MSYISKFNDIRPYVKLNIPWNKKLFTTQEKALITKYHNKLKAMGYLNREQEGYILKDISHSKYKIKNAPRLKQAFVNVGTVVENGNIITDKTAKIKIVNGQIRVKRGGMPYKWEFEYNIKRDWKVTDFRKHIKKQMLPNKPKIGQIFVIGAGIYEMKGTADRDIDNLAKEILKIGNKYYSMVESGKRAESQSPEHFMYRIVVYESTDAFKLRLKNKKKIKKRKKSKYEKRRMR